MISGNELIAEWIQAGIVPPGTQRVVIDIQLDSIPTTYIQGLTDETLVMTLDRMMTSRGVGILRPDTLQNQHGDKLIQTSIEISPMHRKCIHETLLNEYGADVREMRRNCESKVLIVFRIQAGQAHLLINWLMRDFAGEGYHLGDVFEVENPDAVSE